MDEQTQALIDRLDRQANAIRDLRQRVEGLEQAGARAPSTGKSSTPDWEMRPDCLICNQTKPLSRWKNLTCQPCGVEWQASLKTDSPMRFDACLHCGKPWNGKPMTYMQCPDCVKGFKAWREHAGIG